MSIHIKSISRKIYNYIVKSKVSESYPKKIIDKTSVSNFVAFKRPMPNFLVISDWLAEKPYGFSAIGSFTPNGK